MTTSPTQSAASPSLFKVYREHIARDAIYGLREEEPINPSDLNPGIQEDILSWISQQHSREPGGAKEVALLTGSTDPRRSAVACSIVDACEQNESLAATFLTPTGSKVRTQSVDQLLMATLAYQISKLDGFEHLSGLVIEAIGQDMDIFTRPLVDQLDSLILKPLCLIAKRGAPRLVRDDGSPPPIVIVIDIELQKNPIEDGTRGEDENGLMDFLLRAARSSSFPFLIIATIAGGDPRRAIPSKYATEFREFSLDAKGDIHNASGIGVGTGMIDGAVRQEVTLTLSHALVEGVSGAPAEHFDTSSGPSKDFKCNCGDKSCDLKEKIRLKADLLGVSIGTAAFFLNTLKVTACISPIPGLKELSGGLLVFVTTLQAKGEVKGGFNHIIVDCLRVTCIVCEHARRHKNHVSDVVYRAIAQLQHDLEGIRKYAEKMNKRGFGHRLFMASSDKAEVNAWRQRLSISWDFFMTELLMDTHYKVTKADNVDPTELAKRIVEEMVAKHGNQMNHTIVESPPSPTDATTTAMSPPLPDNSQPLWLESLRADEDDYQYTQGDLSNGYSTNYPYFNRNPFRSLTTQPNRPNRRLAPPPHVRSDSSTPYEPTEYYAPPDPYYNQNYGYRHHPPPPPHRYYTMPPSAPSPVNNVGPAMNANFGVNYAT